jgi:hypothetical protein
VSGGVGIAAGAIPGVGGQIDACYSSSSGHLRVLDATQDDACRHGETALSWNQRGPAGARGVDGERGPAGARGDVGPAGPAGPKGEAGAAGPKGDTGPAGPKGDTGDAGAAGPTGPKGADGADGADGPKGDTGAAGPKGEKGDTGDVGPAGPKGDAGPAGPKGADGAQGAKGDTGQAGAAGPAGPAGPKGDTGAMGPAGPSGAVDAWASTFNDFENPVSIGSSETTVRSLTLPAGSYTLSASLTLAQGMGLAADSAPVECDWASSNPAEFVVRSGDASTFTQNGVLTLSSPREVELTCRRLSGVPIDAYGANFTAVKVNLRP